MQRWKQERDLTHCLAAPGERPWAVQRELQLAFQGDGSVQMPGVAEVREELREQWAAERAAQLQLDRQIERVEAAQERPQGAVTPTGSTRKRSR